MFQSTLTTIEPDAALIAEADEAMTKARVKLMANKDSAFFTALCFSLPCSWDHHIPTACAYDLRLVFNPDFFLSLSPDERVFLILHETLHVALMHVARLKEREPRRWNEAADYVINYLLVEKGFKMPQGGLLDAQYKGLSTDEVYDSLPTQPTDETVTVSLDIANDPAGGEDANSNGNAGNLTAEEIQHKLDDILARAKTVAEMSEKGIGSLPGELEIYLKNLCNPTLPWHRILARFFNQTVKSDYSFRKPNRRYFPDMLLPSQHGEGLGEIAIAIDTSGSVTQDEFDHFISETHCLLKRQKPKKVHLLQFDTRIRAHNELTAVSDLGHVRFSGRGGTLIQPVMDWAQQHKPQVLVVFSDGHFYAPEQWPKSHIIWVIHGNTRFKPSKGTVIKYHFKPH